tara:strand:+ start:122 stop:595 length:474 start_codon:yes stop_codon:yes gene_type:complete
MKKKIKKILAGHRSEEKYHDLYIPMLKNYEGRLTLTKTYLNADKDDHNKKIKKNDPLVEFALYDNKALGGKSLGETFLGYWSEGVNMWAAKAEKILITSPVSAIFKYRGDKMAYQNFSLGEIYKQEETFVLLALTSEDKKKNKAEAKKFSGKAQPIY